MNINQFATQITQTGLAGNQALGGQALGGTGLFGIGGIGEGLDFWSVILGNVAEGAETTQTNGNSNPQNLAKQNVSKEKADLALLQLALLGQDPTQSLEEKLSQLKIKELAQTKENRVTQLTKLIDHLTSGLPQQEDGVSEITVGIEALVNRLEKRLERLEASLENFRNGNFESEDVPFKALIATGLNPLQFTKITERINEVETKLGRELTVEDLIVGVGNILPLSPNEAENFSPNDALALFLKSSDGQAINKDAEVKTDAETGINPKEAVQNTQSTEKAVDQFTEVIQRINAGEILPANSSTDQAEISESQGLEGDEFLAAQASTSDLPALINKIKKLLPVFSTLGTQKNSFVAKNNIANAVNQITFDFQTSYKNQDYISDALGFDIDTGMPFNSTIQAATMTTANVQAGQTHPATHIVASKINQAVQNGAPKNIKIQLDPPELGRVEVNLEFGEERTVKAQIISEKPETHLMLQRDAQALERALQNAGLEADGSALDFQLADDGYGFGDGKGESGGYEGGNSADAEDEDEIIETSMSWVDPETGYVHYSILV
ncbi:MAG: flagellar hook-length control protein FliK [Pseudomonadota bacterium]